MLRILMEVILRKRCEFFFIFKCFFSENFSYKVFIGIWVDIGVLSMKCFLGEDFSEEVPVSICLPSVSLKFIIYIYG